MADLQKTIEIIFQGTDALTPETSKIISGVDSTAQALERATAPIAEFTNNLILIEAAAAAAGGVLLYFSVNEAASMEDAMLDLAKVMDEADGEVRDYIPIIEELALKHGENGVAAVAMAADLRQAGASMEEIVGPAGLLDLALRAVKISELDATEAAEWMARTLGSWDKPFSEAEHLLDVVNYTSDVSKISFEELAVAIQTVGPLASKLGFSFEEVTAIMVPMITSLGSGEEAATALTAIFSNLIHPVGLSKEAFETFLPQVDLTSDAFDTVKERLAAVVEVWPSLTEQEQAEFARLIAGKEHVDAFIAAMTSFSSELTANAIAVESVGSSLKEWEIRIDAANVQVDKAVEAFRQLAESIGNQLLVSFASGAEATENLGLALKKVVDSGGLQPLFDAMEPLIQSFLASIDQIATNLPAAFELVKWDSLIEAIGNLTGVFGELFDGIDLSTPEGLAAAIQKLIDVMAGLVNTTAGIADTYLVPILQALLGMASAGAELSPEMQTLIGDFLGLSSSVNTVLGYGGTLIGIVGDLALAFAGLKLAGVTLDFSALTTAVGSAGLLGALTPLQGVILGVGAAWGTWELGKLLISVGDLTNELVKHNEIESQTADTNEKVKETLAKLSEELGIQIDSVDELNKLVDAGILVYNEVTGTWQVAGEKLGALTGTMEDYLKETTDATKETEAVGDAMKETAGSAGDLATGTESTSKAISILRGVSSDATTDIKLLGVGASSAGGDASESADKFSKLNTELVKLPTDVELNFDAQTIQANADVATEAMETLGTVIESTGTLLDSLFGLLIQNPDSPYVEKILEQIDKENELREASFELLQKEVETWVSYLEAKTEALKSGDGLIQIDGGNLQPHLEAFMWEILQAIQVRVNAEGLEMLVGV